MYKAVIIQIYIGFMWLEYQTTSLDEAVSFHSWMEDRGHQVKYADELTSVNREIPNIERITNP